MIKHPRWRAWLVPLALAVAAAGCKEEVKKSEPIRLVRTVTIGNTPSTAQLSFAGEVRARYVTALGFRIGGKIVSRDVEIGSSVRRGQLLARLDPKDLELGVQSLRANLSAAKTELDLARADHRRFADLRAKNFISQAEYDRRRAALRTAQERVAAAQAQLDQARNQVNYAELRADHDGVITALNAEVGQVVAAGQPIAQLARLSEKEVVVSIPEQQVNLASAAQAINVSLWADPERQYRGRIREIAPNTDPATRTYTVKIAVDNADAALRWGMTAQVHLDQAPSATMRLPLAALYTKTGQPSVWVVDPKRSTVSQVPVQTGGVMQNEVIISSGLKPGDIVVVAGANLLIPGQQVRVMQSSPSGQARLEDAKS